MLVLTVNAAKDDQEIYIQTSDGLIKVNARPHHAPNCIQLAFEAPRHIKIDRRKIYEAKQKTITEE